MPAPLVRNPFAATDMPTLLDVLSTVAQDASVNLSRRQGWSSALRSLAAWTHKPLVSIPADPGFVTTLVDRLNAAALEVSTRHLQNVRSRLLAVLQHAGHGTRGQWQAPMTPGWQQLDRHLTNYQRASLRRLIRDGGFVLATVGRREGELSSLIRSVDAVLSTTARRNAELEQTVRILPTTLRELQPTFREIEAFSIEAQPVLRELRPAGRALGPTLVDAMSLAPDVRKLFREIDDVIRVSRRALPATTDTVRAARPVFRELAPALRDLLPVVDRLTLYRYDTGALIAGLAAAFNYSEVSADGKRRNFFRSLIPFGPEGFVINDVRFGTNRHNPYFNPRWLDKLPEGLESIDCRHAGNESVPGTDAPPCKVQKPLPFRGRATQFPQIRRDP